MSVTCITSDVYDEKSQCPIIPCLRWDEKAGLLMFDGGWSGRRVKVGPLVASPNQISSEPQANAPRIRIVWCRRSACSGQINVRFIFALRYSATMLSDLACLLRALYPGGRIVR